MFAVKACCRKKKKQEATNLTVVSLCVGTKLTSCTYNDAQWFWHTHTRNQWVKTNSCENNWSLYLLLFILEAEFMAPCLQWGSVFLSQSHLVQECCCNTFGHNFTNSLASLLVFKNSFHDSSNPPLTYSLNLSCIKWTLEHVVGVMKHHSVLFLSVPWELCEKQSYINRKKGRLTWHLHGVNSI